MMARIGYDSASIGGEMVATAVDTLSELQSSLVRVVAMMNSMTAGGTTPENLEGSTEFGVPTGSGSDFYTSVNNIKATVCAVTAATIGALDKGDI